MSSRRCEVSKSTTKNWLNINISVIVQVFIMIKFVTFCCSTICICDFGCWKCPFVPVVALRVRVPWCHYFCLTPLFTSNFPQARSRYPLNDHFYFFSYSLYLDFPSTKVGIPPERTFLSYCLTPSLLPPLSVAGTPWCHGFIGIIYKLPMFCSFIYINFCFVSAFGMN